MIGNTGGIYTCEAKAGEIDTVLKTMREAIAAGGGGDVPENDLEAILAGIAMRTGEEEIVLIADNLSKIRDFSLLSRIELPIHIILCGNAHCPYGAINPQYLTLAYRTKGSVHTINEHFANLHKLADKAIIMLNGAKYQLRNGEFVRR